jgi:MFS family permease
MLVLAFFCLCVLSVPLARGKLTELAHVRFRAVWALALAGGIQVVILGIAPGGWTGVHAVLHVGSYLLAGWFVVANRRIPGVLLVGAGGALNLITIAANGGMMPVLPSAARAADLATVPQLFHNTAIMASARLPFLGDVFAVPAPYPFNNVFSAGDIFIAIGAAVALHRLCRSRLVPSGTGQFVSLLHHRGFMRLWGAQAASNIGDWVYSLAVATALSLRGGGPEAFAILLILQVAPSAVVGALGGPLVDRMSRKRLMVGSDILRGVAVASLLVVGVPTRAHLYVVAFFLGLFGALFLPSFQASLPDLVPKESLVAANSVVSTTFHVAVMAGPIIGGVLVARFGSTIAFALNAATFGISALLVGGARLPKVLAKHRPTESAVQALRDGYRYIVATPLVRGIFVALGLIMLASALKAPMEPLFILRTLGLRPDALGVVGGAWGVGMVLGSLAAPAVARRWVRERLFALSVVLVGLAVLAASQQTLLSPVLLLWFVAGLGNGSGTVFYESLLQERVPEALRGRVLAASEAMLDGAFLVGVFAAGLVGERLGVRGAFVCSGLMFLLAGLVSYRMIRSRKAGPVEGERERAAAAS